MNDVIAFSSPAGYMGPGGTSMENQMMGQYQ